MMDTAGNKVARKEIAMIKVVAPNMALPGDRLGDPGPSAAAGVSEDFGLAYAYATARTLRIADGPDEVHRNRSPSWSWRAIDPEEALSVQLTGQVAFVTGAGARHRPRPLP